ncbi:uncharacterized protein LOC102717839 [Oryza brachyantha]|nr:uncharacterized protein LOC102717839 [Oryza brachyantha]
MGGGKVSSALASLFGFKSGAGERQQAAAGGMKQQQQQRSCYYQERGRRVWPSDDDDGDYYAERDIDRRASEFIDKVHRGMIATGSDDQDG